LRDTEQRQPGMRIAAALAGKGIRLFRFGELASKTMDLAFLVSRMARVPTPGL